MIAGVTVDLICQCGSGPDDRHLPLGDVEQLWEFVKRIPSEKSPCGGDPGGVGEYWVGLVEHCAKFEHLKGNAILADPLLSKQDWPR